jgi:hypothetical protein
VEAVLLSAYALQDCALLSFARSLS